MRGIAGTTPDYDCSSWGAGMSNWKQEILFYSAVAAGLGGIAAVLQLCGVQLHLGAVVSGSAHPIIAVAVVVLYAVTLGAMIYFKTKATPRKDGVRVESARWGPRPVETKDVTAILKARGSLEGADVEVSVDVFGDPYVGRGKTLWVTYSVTKTVKVQEAHPKPAKLSFPVVSQGDEPIAI